MGTFSLFGADNDDAAPAKMNVYFLETAMVWQQDVNCLCFPLQCNTIMNIQYVYWPQNNNLYQ